jgi:Flp pilus assembly protein TadD
MTACGRHAEKALQLGRGIEADRLLGRSTLAQGQFKDAEAHFQRVLLESPNDVEASFSAGVCNDKLGRYHQAREAFLQTLQANPKHAEARRYLVLLANRAGAKDEARHHLRKLAELVPKGSDVISDLDELISGGAAGASGGAKTN